MDDRVLRAHVVDLLRGKGAHSGVRVAIDGLRPENRNRRPPGAGIHAVWELVEHMRVAQEDLLRYTIDPNWVSPPWPEGYWPPEGIALDDGRWNATVDGFFADLDAFIALAQDPAVNLTAPIPHATEHTPLRELLLAADHTSYHLGQIVATRKVLGDWR